MDELVTLMRAVLLAQLQLLEPLENRQKPEIFLHKAGIGAPEIARILGKNSAAVQKTIQRAR